MSVILSIAICTHNRADLLRSAIESVLDQDFPRDTFELIVVDNRSTDTTEAVVKRMADGRDNIRYVFEEKQGLSHARNRGWREARGEYVGFLDDDARALDGWLLCANHISRDVAPAAFGGPYSPFYVSPKPAWYSDRYGSFEQGDEARCIGEKEYLRGGNMFVRRIVLEALGGFDTAFGMKGNEIGYGEETELVERIRRRQGDNCLYFDPRLRVEHLVRPEKMKWGWIIRQRFADGRDYYNLFSKSKEPATALQLGFRIVLHCLLLSFDATLGVAARDRRKFPRFQNYFYEHTGRYLAAFGELAEQLRKRWLPAGKR